jgi:hypothetical protein
VENTGGGIFSLVRAAALQAFKSPLCGYHESVALREKVQGAMMSGSPSVGDVFGQSSSAAKADKIYSDSDKTTTGFSSRLTQAEFSAI